MLKKTLQTFEQGYSLIKRFTTLVDDMDLLEPVIHSKSSLSNYR